MRRLMAWSLGIAFIGGLLGPDAVGVIFTALATFVLAFAIRRTTLHTAALSLTAWATGAAMGVLLTLLEQAPSFAPPSRTGAGVTVLTAYVSAIAGTWVNWVARRLVREGSAGVR